MTTLSLAINHSKEEKSVFAPFTPLRKLSIPDLLNYDQGDINCTTATSFSTSAISTSPSPSPHLEPAGDAHSISPSSSTFSLSTGDSLNWDSKSTSFVPPLDYDDENTPVLIEVGNLPVLQLARRHYHLCDPNSKVERHKHNQGRPFTANLNLQFFFHNDFQTLIHTLLKKKTYKIINFNHIDSVNLVELPLLVEAYPDFKKNHCHAQMEISKILRCEFVSVTTLKYNDELGAADFRCERKAMIYEPASGKDNLNQAMQICFSKPGFTFIRVIRSSTGKTIKLETVAHPHFFESEWIKRKVCFPRYKSGMKIYLINTPFMTPTVVYNDLRMFYWDLKNYGSAYFVGKDVSVINEAS